MLLEWKKRWSLGSGTGRRAGRGLSARDQASCKLDQTANCSFPPVPYNLVIFHCGRLERIINYCLPLAISALNQVRKAKKGKEKKKKGCWAENYHWENGDCGWVLWPEHTFQNSAHLSASIASRDGVFTRKLAHGTDKGWPQQWGWDTRESGKMWNREWDCLSWEKKQQDFKLTTKHIRKRKTGGAREEDGLGVGVGESKKERKWSRAQVSFLVLPV